MKNSQKKMKWVGLTGGIATGKSSVAKILKTLNVVVADADDFARQALEPGAPPYNELVRQWGSEFLLSNKEVDRPRLGKLVFQNSNKKRQLEGWVHPFVQKRVSEVRSQWQEQGEPWAVYDVPLLFEKKMQNQFDDVTVVYCRAEQQLQRLQLRSPLSLADCQQRLKSQIDIEIKKQQCDRWIDNQGTIEELKDKVLNWKRIIDEQYI